MTDLELFQALPENERETLGFMQWRQRNRATTHGEGCYTWGPAHYSCALAEIGRLQAESQKGKA